MSDTSVQNFGSIGGPTLRAQGAQTIYQFGRHQSSTKIKSIMASPSGELARAAGRDLRSDMKRGEQPQRSNAVTQVNVPSSLRKHEMVSEAYVSESPLGLINQPKLDVNIFERQSKDEMSREAADAAGVEESPS